ncbi:hypothetical protein Tco_0348861 [Tanacetum coccineum]
MALMAFTDSEVSIDKSCSKSCLNNYEALKKQYDDLLVKLDDTGLEEFKQPETVTKTSFVKSPLKVDKDWKEKLFYPANHVREEEPKNARENTDAPIIEDWVSDDEEEVEPIPQVEKKTAIPTATKKESVKPEKPIRRSVSCPKHMVPRAVLMKTDLKTVNNARPVNTVRSVNSSVDLLVFYKEFLSLLHVSTDQDNQDCIVMPIWKDASYFDDASPRSVADAQIQDQNGLHDVIDDSERLLMIARLSVIMGKSRGKSKLKGDYDYSRALCDFKSQGQNSLFKSSYWSLAQAWISVQEGEGQVKLNFSLNALHNSMHQAVHIKE